MSRRLTDSSTNCLTLWHRSTYAPSWGPPSLSQAQKGSPGQSWLRTTALTSQVSPCLNSVKKEKKNCTLERLWRLWKWDLMREICVPVEQKTTDSHCPHLLFYWAKFRFLMLQYALHILKPKCALCWWAYVQMFVSACVVFIHCTYYSICKAYMRHLSGLCRNAAAAVMHIKASCHAWFVLAGSCTTLL